MVTTLLRPLFLAALGALGLLPACTPEDPADRVAASDPPPGVAASAIAASTQTAGAPADGASSGDTARPLVRREEDAGDPAAELPADVVARVDGLDIAFDELDRYLGTVYARQPEGETVFEQLVTETLVALESDERGIVVDAAMVDAAVTRLDELAREASGGEAGLMDSLTADVQLQELRAGVRLMVELEQIVRHEQGLADDVPLEPEVLNGWITERRATAVVEPRPLDDPLYATVDGVPVTRVQVGRRMRSTMTDNALAGVVNEMMGIRVVAAEAERRGVELTEAAIEAELADREARMDANPDMRGVSYLQAYAQLKHRDRDELVASEQFRTQVLLRQIAELDWDDLRASVLFDEERAAFARARPDLDPPFVTYEDVRAEVWSEILQRTYTGLFEDVTIVRRH